MVRGGWKKPYFTSVFAIFLRHGFIQKNLIKMHSLFILCLYTKDNNLKLVLCGYIMTQISLYHIWYNRQSSGQSANENFLSRSSQFLLFRCFFVSNNHIKISVYELNCVILALLIIMVVKSGRKLVVGKSA